MKKILLIFLLMLFKDSTREMCNERHLIESFFPYFFDRVIAHTRVMDAQSTYYVNFLVAAYMYERMIVKPAKKVFIIFFSFCFLIKDFFRRKKKIMLILVHLIKQQKFLT